MSEQTYENVQVDEQIIALGGATEVGATIEMGVGAVNIAAIEEIDAAALLDATFTYSVPEWQPEVIYHVEGEYGKLRVKQPEYRVNLCGEVKYIWDLGFNPSVPLDLTVKLGSGRANLNLGTLNLMRFVSQVGSGVLDADLSGNMADLTDINITTASGRTNLNMQGNYSDLDEIVVSTASGKLDVKLDGAYASLEKLVMRSASGKINAQLVGQYPSMEKLSVDTASGVIFLDLSGQWTSDLEAAVNCVSGVIKVRLPEDVGVAVNVNKLTGHVNAPGFHREGKLYVNDTYGKSDVTLHLKISTVSGMIKLQLGDVKFRTEE